MLHVGHLDQVALQELLVNCRRAQPGAAEGSGVLYSEPGMAEAPGTQNMSPPSWNQEGQLSVMTA